MVPKSGNHKRAHMQAIQVISSYGNNGESRLRSTSIDMVMVSWVIADGLVLTTSSSLLPYSRKDELEMFFGQLIQFEGRCSLSQHEVNFMRRKMVVFLKLVFTALVQTGIRCTPLLAMEIAILIPDIPVNCFHIPPVSYLPKIMEYILAATYTSSRATQVARIGITSIRNFVMWTFFVHSGIIMIMIILLGSLFVILSLTMLER